MKLLSAEICILSILLSSAAFAGSVIDLDDKAGKSLQITTIFINDASTSISKRPFIEVKFGDGTPYCNVFPDLAKRNNMSLAELARGLRNKGSFLYCKTTPQGNFEGESILLEY